MRTFPVIGALFLITLSGCATRLPLVEPQIRFETFPPLSELREVEVGEVVLSRVQLAKLPAMNLKERIEVGDVLIRGKWRIDPGTLVANTEDNKYLYYGSDRFTSSAMLSMQQAYGGLRISKTNPDDVDIFFSLFYKIRKLKTMPDFELHEIALGTDSDLMQEIIYSGRTGDAARFLYRESSGKDLAEISNHYFDFELSGDRRVAYRGARFEIIEATNSKLKYTAIANFIE